MRRFILPVIALSIAAAPAVVAAQTPRGERGPLAGQVGPRLMAGNPAARVLQHRETLGLSAAQVEQLEQLQQQLEQRNQPLLQQLQASRPGIAFARRGAQLTPEQREQLRQRAQERRAQLTPEQREQLRQRAQERQAHLTPEQRERLQSLREQMREATPEQRAQLRTQVQELMQQYREQLTPEQREQLRQRFSQQRAERPQPTAGQRAQFEALRPVLEQLRASNEQARRDVQAVLTAEQQERLRTLVRQRGDEVRERRGAPRGRPAPGARGGASRR